MPYHQRHLVSVTIDNTMMVDIYSCSFLCILVPIFLSSVSYHLYDICHLVYTIYFLPPISATCKLFLSKLRDVKLIRAVCQQIFFSKVLNVTIFQVQRGELAALVPTWAAFRRSSCIRPRSSARRFDFAFVRDLICSWICEFCGVCSRN